MLTWTPTKTTDPAKTPQPETETMRDFMPLAQAQNRAVWKDYPHGCPAKFAAALDASADRSQCRYLEARRGRLEAAIAECSRFPAQFWSHKYFRLLTGSCVASTTEAVTELKRQLRMELNRKSHWSYKPERVVDLREALVFARFFRRNSRRVWARKEAA